MAGQSTTSLTFPEPHIAVITLDNPERSANILSQHTLAELEQHFDAVEQRDDIHGLVICSNKPGMFIAGADITEFVSAMQQPGDHTAHAEEMCRKGQTLFARLSQMPLVTVAAIDGVCVGGGAELSLWCDRRVLSKHPRAEIGLPEVKIGLIPGWGGTVRLPRIAGLSNAIEAITSGESIKAHDALQLGIVSTVVASDQLVDAAIRLAKLEYQRGEYKEDRRRWSEPINLLSDTEMAFLNATASAMIAGQTKGNYPAPVVALETMMKGARMDAEAACQLEAKGLAKLFGGEANRSLINVFLITDRNKKDQGVTGGKPPASLTTVGVIGAGIMGSGIAGAHLKRHVHVYLADSSSDALSRGVRNTLEEVSFDRATKSANPKKLLEFAPHLQSASDLDELAQCDLVIEAVIEQAAAKKQIFEKLESVMRPDAIIATNTSTIPVTELGKGLKHPERFCGLHFFNPVRRMMLVEVIRGPLTSDETIATSVAHVKKLGKYPVVVQDGPGFLVNRLLFPYMNEALLLLEEGVPMEAIDRAAKQFGLPMGPIELHDMVGLDTALYAGGVMQAALPDRMIESPILGALVSAGRLGNKTGQGFYSYKNRKGKRTADPDVQALMKPFIKSESPEVSPENLMARLILPMLLEATDVLAAGLVRDVRDVDLGLIYGIGFPPFKGGLLFWADHQGLSKIMSMLEPLQSVGKRFEPTEYLKDLVSRDAKFYGQ